MTRLNLYNPIALWYDRLAVVLLGKEYRKSKWQFLDKIQQGDKVLYLGGGSGNNLSYILGQVGKTGKVYYFEASSRFIQIALQKISPLLKNRIQPIHACKWDKIPNIRFDIILTQYFLDVLEDKDIEGLFFQLQQRTHKDTAWICCDFWERPEKNLLLGTMLLFFRIITKHPRTDLPDYESYFVQSGWETLELWKNSNGFIQCLYLKPKKFISEIGDG